MPFELSGRNRIFAVFGIIYAILISSVVFFLFFAPGLGFEKTGAGSDLKVFLKNSSGHLIRDINVSTANGLVLFQSRELKPGEKIEIPRQSLQRLNEIVATAPFHAAASLDLIDLAAYGAQIRYEIIYPQIAVKNYPFSMTVKVCNSGETAKISVNEQHAVEFFDKNSESRNVSAGNGNCESVAFEFTPLKQGFTEILFNISSLNFNETISKKIEVK